MKLPLRFRILHLLSQEHSLSEREVMDHLESEYGNEGQFIKSNFENHLESMRAVGMVEPTEATIDAKGKLQQKYKITDYGRQRLSYLPKNINNSISM